MACNCKKRNLATQPKRVSKPSTSTQSVAQNGKAATNRRIFKRAVR